MGLFWISSLVLRASPGLNGHYSVVVLRWGGCWAAKILSALVGWWGGDGSRGCWLLRVLSTRPLISWPVLRLGGAGWPGFVQAQLSADGATLMRTPPCAGGVRSDRGAVHSATLTGFGNRIQEMRDGSVLWSTFYGLKHVILVELCTSPWWGARGFPISPSSSTNAESI